MRAIMRFLTEYAKKFAACACLAALMAGGAIYSAGAQAVDFGLNLSGGKEPVKIDADNMEMRDKEGTAILTGNVSVEQGDRLIRAGKMIVHYNKVSAKQGEAASANAEVRPGRKHKPAANGLGATGIESLDVSGKVYIKNGKQIAVGDNGTFSAATNIMVLTGAKIVLTDGENVATGCKLTAHMDTGRAFLESCSSPRQKGRVSVIVNRSEQN